MSSAGGANAHQIVARGLTKRYGVVQALNDLDLTISEGEVFGFLGTNGAGKTTTVLRAGRRRDVIRFCKPKPTSCSGAWTMSRLVISEPSLAMCVAH